MIGLVGGEEVDEVAVLLVVVDHGVDARDQEGRDPRVAARGHEPHREPDGDDR